MKLRNSWFAFLFIAVASGSAHGGEIARHSDAIPGRYIVVMRRDPGGARAPMPQALAQAQMELALRSEFGANVHRRYERVLAGFLVETSEEQARKLALDARVALVEEDAPVHTTEQAASWGIDRIDQRDLPLDDSYNPEGSGAGVHIYVIDTGIRSTHSELLGRVRNGFSTIEDGLGTEDCYGHGTHVAGTAAGRSFGVAREAQVHPVRVLDCSGSGTLSGVIAGVDWVTAQAAQPAVVNMSLGAAASPALDGAIQQSISSGLRYVVSAGNSNADACLQSPARVPEALSVGSTTETDARSSFSNIGPCVDLFAPGSEIRSAWNTDDAATAVLSGTSMASPHVAGIGALVLERFPTLTQSELSQFILRMATVGRVDDAQGTRNLLAHSLLSSPPDPHPIASFSFDCIGRTCSFDASASSALHGIVDYRWDFGDGSSGEGRTTVHEYARAAFHNATLTVRETQGEEDSVTQPIAVNAVAPTPIPLDRVWPEFPPPSQIAGPPAIAVDGDVLTMIQAWRSVDDNVVRLIMARSTDRGRTWGEALPVLDLCPPCLYPYRVVDDAIARESELFVLVRSNVYWPEEQATLYHSRDNGATWTNSRVPFPADRTVVAARLLQDQAGTLFVLGTTIGEEGTIERTLLLTSSRDSGATWSEPVVLALALSLWTWPDFDAQIADGTLHVVWTDQLGGGWPGPPQLHYIRFDTAAGSVLSEEEPCSGWFSDWLSKPKLHVQGSEVRVVFHNDGGDTDDLFVTSRLDDGGSWSTCRAIPRTPLTLNGVLILTIQGSASHFLIAARVGEDLIYWESLDGARTWSEPQPLRVGPEAIRWLAVQSDSTDHHFLWSEWTRRPGDSSLLSLNYASLPVAPTEALSCSTSRLTIPQGGSGDSTCRVSSPHGFAGAVDLSCSDLPEGVSCSFDPNPLTPPPYETATSALTLAVPASTPPGTYEFQVHAVSESLARSIDMTLQVPPLPPDFTINCGASTLTIPPGSGDYRACTVTSELGFASPVELSCANLPAGVSCGYVPNAVTPPPNGSATSALTVAVSASTPPGVYGFRVQGVSGSQRHTQNVILKVPDFTFSCSPVSFTLWPGNSHFPFQRNSRCFLSSQYGESPVDLRCTNLPPGATCIYEPDRLTPPAEVAGSTNLSLELSASTPPGVYSFQAQAVSGSVTRIVEMTLQVPDFTLSCNPSSMTIPQGSSGHSTCTVSMQRNTGDDNVSFSCANLPAGVSCTHNPDLVEPPANGSATSALAVAVSPSTPAGTYSFQVQAAVGPGAGRTRTFDLTLEVTSPPPDFTIGCNPSSLTILQGSSGSSNCTVGSQNGFTDEVGLSCTNLPAGVTCTHDPNPVTPPANESATSALTVAVSAATLPGTYSLRVQAVGGSLARAFDLTLQVTPPPDFTIDCSPSGLTVLPGMSGSGICAVGSQHGFTAEVALSCTNLPPGVSCTSAPNPVTPPTNASGTSALTVDVSATTPPGTYSFRVQGAGGSLTHTFDMTLQVPDFTLSCSPTRLSIAKKSNGTSTCVIASRYGFAGEVGLSCTGLPAAVQCDYGTDPLTLAANGSATSALTVAVDAGIAPGTYSFRVHAARGSLTRSFTMTLQVLSH